jgi:hypothetical protein
MEVREIVETIVREPVLEVRFRMDVDGDDVIRVKEFIIEEMEDYGYSVITDDFDIFESITWSDDEEEYDYEDHIVFDTSYSDGQYKKTADNQKLMDLYPSFEYTNIQTGIHSAVTWFNQNISSCRK